jgi:cation:H+ antiporter
VIGNVVGSNIANIGLVLGVAAVVRPFPTELKMHDRDGFILLPTALVLFGVAFNNRIGRIDAAAFLVLYMAYLVFAQRTDREGIQHQFRDFLRFVFDLEYVTPVTRRLARRRRGGRPAQARPVPTNRRRLALELGAVGLSLAALILGARFVVVEAVWMARLLDIPENLIGLSPIAVGTSLPELLVSVSAAKKGKTELLVGNVMGSNIANVLLILGASATVRPLRVSELLVVYTIPIMIFFSLALLFFLRSHWRIRRGEGVFAVSAYAAFLTAAFLQGWE